MSALTKEQSAKLPKGFALRTHLSMVTDMTSAMSYATEIMELRRETFDPELFKVPDDYRRIDVTKMMRPPGL